MAISSLEQLKDYCFRKLGQPVINIEVSSVQAYERINDAIQYFVERHYNGTEEIFYKHTITRTDVDNGYITIPHKYVAILDVMLPHSSSSGERMFDYQWQIMANLNDIMLKQSSSSSSNGISNFFISMSYIDMLSKFFDQSYSFDYNSVSNRLYPKWNFSDVGSGNILLSPSDISSPDWNKINSTVQIDAVPDINGTNHGVVVTSNGPGQYGITQTIDTKQYVRGTYTLAISTQKGNSSAPVTIEIRDSIGNIIGSKTFAPNQLWDKTFILLNYDQTNADDFIINITSTATVAGETFHIFNPWLYANSIVILHGFRALDGTSTNIYDDRWVKQYSTALIKQQWGTNLKKFDQVQLPGGVTLNGKEIYDEATEEINALLEEFTENYEEIPIGGWF